MNELAFTHALSSLRVRITALKLRALLNVTGSFKAAWEANDTQLYKAEFSLKAISFFNKHRNEWNEELEAKKLQDSGINLISLVDADYPLLLKEIYDPPVGLYVRGSLIANDLSVAFVGSRKASPYGRTATQALVRPLASLDLTIVSGLAYGIDAEAHKAALAVQGRTVAVLGGGIDNLTLYPRAHRGLANQIIEQGGAIISEYPPGTEPRPEFFPQRNRLVAGVSQVIVVIEAAKESGALITARVALAENREVFAVPGPINSSVSQGTNNLLKEGAAPATEAQDILESLTLKKVIGSPIKRDKWKPKKREPKESQPLPLTPSEKLLCVLSSEPQSIDTIVIVSKLPAHEASAALSLLELEDRVRDVGGKNYVRI